MASTKPDVVGGICDLAGLQRLVEERTPRRPAKKLVARHGAESLAAMVCRHFNFGLGPRIMPYREEWIDAINSTQRADGSWDVPADSCPWCGEARVIGRITAALWHLGGRPRRPVSFVERMARRATLLGWLRGLNWDHPWGGAGHDCIGLVQAMANVGVCSRGTVQTVLDFVNSQMREAGTGLIARGRFGEAGDQQFGSAFAFGIIFEFFKADFPWAERLVEFVLSRQRRSGSWSREFPGGSFNMDAAWMLSRWTRLGSPLRGEAEKALKRLARWLRREVAKLRGEARAEGLMSIATTLLLLQEVFPSESHRSPVWRYSCDMTIHP